MSLDRVLIVLTWLNIVVLGLTLAYNVAHGWLP